MSVLIEGVSVVIRCDVLSTAFPGGLSQFGAVVPNKSYCADGEVARVGFDTLQQAQGFVVLLESHGMQAIREGKAGDLVIADQASGLMAACDWAEFGRLDLEGDPQRRVAFCRLKGSELAEMLTPDNWQYAHSLSAKFSYVEHKN
jgi:hypothetical protein